MKTCSKCKISKNADLDSFYSYSRSVDRLSSWCKSCFSEHRKAQYKDNAMRIKERNKLWKNNNKESQKTYIRQYMSTRMAQDANFKLAQNLRSRLRSALRSNSISNDNRFKTYLGCSLEELRMHLESKFASGMTWENYGKWHIDHIIPLSSAKDFDSLIKLCHFSNLQPLWAVDNLSKGAKIEVSL